MGPVEVATGVIHGRHAGLYESLLRGLETWPRDRIQRFVKTSGCVAACGGDGRVFSRAVRTGHNIAMLQFLRSHGAHMRAETIIAAVNRGKCRNVAEWILRNVPMDHKSLFEALIVAFRYRASRLIELLIRHIPNGFFACQHYCRVITKKFINFAGYIRLNKPAFIPRMFRLYQRMRYLGIGIRPDRMCTIQWKLVISVGTPQHVEHLLSGRSYPYQHIVNAFKAVIECKRHDLFNIIFARGHSYHVGRFSWPPLLRWLIAKSSIPIELYQTVAQWLYETHGPIEQIRDHNEILIRSIQSNPYYLDRHLLLIKYGADISNPEIMRQALMNSNEEKILLELISHGVSLEHPRLIYLAFQARVTTSVFKILLDSAPGTYTFGREIISHGANAQTPATAELFLLAIDAMIARA